MKLFKFAESGATALFQSPDFRQNRDWKRAVAPLGLLLFIAAPALAVDHDNVDAGRPLDFDDAETIAYRERAIEFGGAVFGQRGDAVAAGGSAEFLSGFARNWQLNLGVDPQLNRAL